MSPQTVVHSPTGDGSFAEGRTLGSGTAQTISKIPANKLTGNRNLKNEKISLDGAENSLLKKLENVQKKKAEWEQSQKSKDTKDTETKGYESGSTAAVAKAKAAVVTSTVRKARKPEETAESLESAVIAVGDQEEDWTTIPTG